MEDAINKSINTIFSEQWDACFLCRLPIFADVEPNKKDNGQKEENSVSAHGHGSVAYGNNRGGGPAADLRSEA